LKNRQESRFAQRMLPRRC